MNALSILVIPALVSSFYCLMVCVCVAGRMSRSTSHIIRFPIVILGAVAAWAILRTIEGNWQINWSAISHAVTMILAAIVLALCPRIRT
ncbi:hypothetical protein D3C76_346540 [compost metagenome]